MIEVRTSQPAPADARDDREPRHPFRLVVLADSTAFTDATGPRLPDHPELYPNRVAAGLQAAWDREVAVTVIARAGTTVREVERTLFKDRHVQFDVVAPADAVIVGVGSFDHAPAGVPPAISAALPYIRSARRRQQARLLAHRAYPAIVRARGGYTTRTPWEQFALRYTRTLEQVRGLTQGQARYVALGPTSHDGDYYGRRHPGHVVAERAQLDLARAAGFTPIAVWPHVVDHVDELNVDGIHWPAAAHRAIARAVVDALR
jgi:lysophospholipase L1-like esterase